MSLEKVFKYIDDNMNRFVEEFQEFLKIPSVSARGEALDECADFCESLMKKSGVDTVEKLKAGGPYVLYGKTMIDEKAKTLLCYGHYDVQPEDPLDEWISPPFEANIIDDVIYARGAVDNKGGVMAFLKAQEAFKAVMGRAPLNLKYIFEGEEEIGSPHLDSFCIKYGDKLKADGMHCLDGGVNPSRLSPEIELGLKGILYVELISKVAKQDNYSGGAALVENAAWRLVHALNTIMDVNGKILIEGWYDDYLPPTKEDLDLIKKEVQETSEEELLKHLGVGKFGYDRSMFEALKERYYGGTATINGIVGGYTGEGGKTIVPAKAKAKMDFRLPPNFNADKQLKRLEKHLEKNGFKDVEVVCLTGRGYPYKIPITEDLAQAIIESAEEIFGNCPSIHGLTQEDIIRHHIGLPVVLTGFGPPDCNLHAPNENMPLDYFNKGIKYAAMIMDKYSRR